MNPDLDPRSRSDIVAELMSQFADMQNRGELADFDSFVALHAEFEAELREYRDTVNWAAMALAPLKPDISAAERAECDKQIGTFVGDFQLLAVIGIGGMGVVYRARQVGSNRDVALKVIRQAFLLDSTYVQRFQSEIRCLERLNHQHIVPIHHIGVAEGRHYFVMQLIDGGSLSGPLPGTPKDEIRRLTPVVDALRAAHQAGVIHRDLKPSNLLLDHDGHCYISDFGLAHDVSPDQPALVSLGDRAGTLLYMAPERLSGNPVAKTLGDIYSIGMILFERIAGTPLFTGEGVWLPDQIRKGANAKRFAVIEKLANRDLRSIIERCVCPDPRKRYQSSDALLEDLNNWLQDLPVAARPVSMSERFWRWCRRNPLVAGLGSLALLAIALGTTVAFWFAQIASSRAVENEKLAEKYQLEATAARTTMKLAVLRSRQVKDQLKLLTSILHGLNPERTQVDDAGLRQQLAMNLRHVARSMSHFAEQEGIVGIDHVIECAGILSDIGYLADAKVLLSNVRNRVLITLTQDSLEACKLDMEIGRIEVFEGDTAGGVERIERAAERMRRSKSVNAEELLRANVILAEIWLGIPTKLEDSRSLFESILRESDADSPTTGDIYIKAKHGIAAAWYGLGELARSETELLSAIRLTERLNGNSHVNLARLHVFLGNLYRDMGRLDESCEQLEKAHLTFELLLGPGNGETIAALNMLMVTYAVAVRDEESKKRLRDILPKAEKSCETASIINGRDNPTVLQMLDNFAGAAGVAGEIEKCVSIRRDVVGRLEAAYGNGDARTMRACVNLAIALHENGQLPEAAELLSHFVDSGGKHPDISEQELMSAKKDLYLIKAKLMLDLSRLSEVPKREGESSSTSHETKSTDSTTADK